MCDGKKRGLNIYKLIVIASSFIRFLYITNQFEILEYDYLINFVLSLYLSFNLACRRAVLQPSCVCKFFYNYKLFLKMGCIYEDNSNI